MGIRKNITCMISLVGLRENTSFKKML
uniref:Uncharacterized protein n=1 Tax=Anguilla anguilla TaxID=7936 RepID=A0A0E9QDA8_ANGAN